jgi:hypothetical protein
VYKSNNLHTPTPKATFMEENDLFIKYYLLLQIKHRDTNPVIIIPLVSKHREEMYYCMKFYCSGMMS